jgi:dTDP-4-dehydrorhamnose reductase
MNVLITGSSGFLGQYLIKSAPHSFHVTAHYFQNPPQDFGIQLDKISVDFRKFPEKKLQELHPDIIIHTAAMASIDACEDQPHLAREINYDATCQLTNLSEELKSRLIFISSDVVFDGIKGDYREEDQPHPLNVYAETKRESEKYILQNHSNAVVIRPALFYGVALGGRRSFTETMLAQLRAGKNIMTFIDQYRTPIFVHDLALAIWELVQHNYKGILHLGGPQKLNRYDMGLMLCDLFKLNSELLIPVKSAEVQLKASRPLDCSLNTALARGVLNTELLDCFTGLQTAFQN